MKKKLQEIKGHLMSGISFVLPLIIGASLVVAIPKMIALGMGITSLDPYADAEGFKHILYAIEQVGWVGIGLINTVLAGFIAYSIGDKAKIRCRIYWWGSGNKYQCRFSWRRNRRFFSRLFSQMV